MSTHISDGNSARKAGSKKEMTRENQSFQKLIQFLYFSRLFIYLFVIHRDEYRVTWGSADLTLVKIRCFILKKNLEKVMAPHSSILAWKVPWMEEPGGLQSMGSIRVRHD